MTTCRIDDRMLLTEDMGIGNARTLGIWARETNSSEKRAFISFVRPMAFRCHSPVQDTVPFFSLGRATINSNEPRLHISPYVTIVFLIRPKGRAFGDDIENVLPYYRSAILQCLLTASGFEYHDAQSPPSSTNSTCAHIPERDGAFCNPTTLRSDQPNREGTLRGLGSQPLRYAEGLGNLGTRYLAVAHRYQNPRPVHTRSHSR